MVPAGEGPGSSAHQIPVTVHGHYLVEVPPGPGPHPLLVGFHGYAETAAVHLKELRRLPGAEAWLRVAVQGLHSFYRSRTGEVAAGWMTRFNRELAIRDNIAYAAAVVSAVKARHAVGEALVYLGFSQGVAMAYRAAAGSGHQASGLIALGGDVPPEVGAGELTGFPPVLLARGEEDEAYPAAKHRDDLAVLRSKGVTVEACTFAGGHEFADPFRERAGRFLAERRG